MGNRHSRRRKKGEDWLCQTCGQRRLPIIYPSLPSNKWSEEFSSPLNLSLCSKFSVTSTDLHVTRDIDRMSSPDLFHKCNSMNDISYSQEILRKRPMPQPRNKVLAPAIEQPVDARLKGLDLDELENKRHAIYMESAADVDDMADEDAHSDTDTVESNEECDAVNDCYQRLECSHIQYQSGLASYDRAENIDSFCDHPARITLPATSQLAYMINHQKIQTEPLLTPETSTCAADTTNSGPVGLLASKPVATYVDRNVMTHGVVKDLASENSRDSGFQSETHIPSYVNTVECEVIDDSSGMSDVDSICDDKQSVVDYDMVYLCLDTERGTSLSSRNNYYVNSSVHQTSKEYTQGNLHDNGWTSDDPHGKKQASVHPVSQSEPQQSNPDQSIQSPNIDREILPIEANFEEFRFTTDSSGGNFFNETVQLRGVIPEEAIPLGSTRELCFSREDPERHQATFNSINVKLVSNVFQFLPHGMQFNSPIMVQFPHTGDHSFVADNFKTKVKIFHSDTGTNEPANWVEVGNQDAMETSDISTVIMKHTVCLFLKKFCLYAAVEQNVPTKYVDMSVYGTYYRNHCTVKICVILTAQPSDTQLASPNATTMDYGKFLNKQPVRLIDDVKLITINMMNIGSAWELASSPQQKLEKHYVWNGQTLNTLFRLRMRTPNRTEDSLFCADICLKHDDSIIKLSIIEDVTEMDPKPAVACRLHSCTPPATPLRHFTNPAQCEQLPVSSPHALVSASLPDPQLMHGENQPLTNNTQSTSDCMNHSIHDEMQLPAGMHDEPAAAEHGCRFTSSSASDRSDTSEVSLNGPGRLILDSASKESKTLLNTHSTSHIMSDVSSASTSSSVRSASMSPKALRHPGTEEEAINNEHIIDSNTNAPLTPSMPPKALLSPGTDEEATHIEHRFDFIDLETNAPSTTSMVSGSGILSDDEIDVSDISKSDSIVLSTNSGQNTSICATSNISPNISHTNRRQDVRPRGPQTATKPKLTQRFPCFSEQLGMISEGSHQPQSQADTSVAGTDLLPAFRGPAQMNEISQIVKQLSPDNNKCNVFNQTVNIYSHQQAHPLVLANAKDLTKPKLDHKTKIELARQLDPERMDGKDWRALAHELGFGAYLSQFKLHPTWTLLQIWEGEGSKMTVPDLIKHLNKIGRMVAAEMVQNACLLENAIEF